MTLCAGIGEYTINSTFFPTHAAKIVRKEINEKLLKLHRSRMKLKISTDSIELDEN